VFLSLMVGLAATAALGLAMVGSFNLVSIAFFVLFVGLGVDFGIQFSVRYRTERYEHHDLRKALRWAARKAADPLALAAGATAVGFLAFLPTSYRGLSELGLIAGCGMLVAFFCAITLVPATLALLNPAGEPEPVGFAGLAPLDDARFSSCWPARRCCGNCGSTSIRSICKARTRHRWSPTINCRTIR
jgi:uncharacterized protein